MVGHGPPSTPKYSPSWLPQLLLPDPDLLDVGHQQTLGLLLLLRPVAWGLLLFSFYCRLQVRALCSGRDLGGSREGGKVRM